MSTCHAPAASNAVVRDAAVASVVNKSSKIAQDVLLEIYFTAKGLGSAAFTVYFGLLALRCYKH